MQVSGIKFYIIYYTNSTSPVRLGAWQWPPDAGEACLARDG